MATVTNLPGTLNIQVYIGATFSLSLTWNSDGSPVDLTGYSAAMKIVNGQETIASLTDGDGITLGTTDGTIAITISSDDTTAYTSQTANYDLLLTSSGGTVYPLIAGVCTIRRGSTV